MSIEIPKGIESLTVLDCYTTAEGIHFCETDCTRKSLIRWAAINANGLAAEIKRLEAAKSATAKTLTHLSANNEALMDENKELRARIAALESALGLPEGCDVWTFERAKQEDVIDEDGTKYRFTGLKQDSLVEFMSLCKKPDFRLVDIDTGAYKTDRLYCRKEANK